MPNSNLFRSRHAVLPALIALASCSDGAAPTVPEPDPVDEVLTIPVVVHVVHRGEPIGEGTNLSAERIEGQIRTLNEDFRRKPGTPGFNSHPDGNDARIEFLLARVDPTGAPTTGIRRIAAETVQDPEPSNGVYDHFARYGYWDPERYVNVWTMPLSEDLHDTVLGMATGPETDLPGADLLTPGEPHQAEGILVNAAHFGTSDLDSPNNRGRTLTHEMGHYLGLLHLWGGGDCEANDYCADTPAVASPVTSCPTSPRLGCDGRPIMFQNYMGYAPDACMSVFTNDQITRMRHVLAHSPRRSGLATSPALGAADGSRVKSRRFI